MEVDHVSRSHIRGTIERRFIDNNLPTLLRCASDGHPPRITVPANFNGYVMATRLRRILLAEERIRTLTDTFSRQMFHVRLRLVQQAHQPSK